MENQTEKIDSLPSYTASPEGQDEFQRLTGSYRRELLVHCYRFFGSLDEAEDALQETWLRAWRGIDTLRDRSALRAWLYRIATNVSLDMLEQRKALRLPELAFPPADPRQPLPSPAVGLAWIDPLPDDYLDGRSLNPEARIELSESVSLAFLTVLQLLPGRQRAVLLLRDVLGWNAQETAELLGISLAAANSALQRARATLKKRHPSPTLKRRDEAGDRQTEDLLKRYVRAWEQADANGLVSLLREDAVWTMPPLPAWFRGRAAIGEFLEGQLFPGRVPGEARLVATRANGGPAFAAYHTMADGSTHVGAFQVLTLLGEKIARIDSYLNPDEKLLSRFNF